MSLVISDLFFQKWRHKRFILKGFLSSIMQLAVKIIKATIERSLEKSLFRNKFA